MPRHNLNRATVAVLGGAAICIAGLALVRHQQRLGTTPEMAEISAQRSRDESTTARGVKSGQQTGRFTPITPVPDLVQAATLKQLYNPRTFPTEEGHQTHAVEHRIRETRAQSMCL